MSFNMSQLGFPISAEEVAQEKELPLEAKDFHSRRLPGGYPAGRAQRRILFVIDQLCQLGGAERVLLTAIRLLPKDRFRGLLLTFQLEPSLVGRLPCPYFLFPLKKTYDLNAVKVAWQLRSLLLRERVDIVHTFFETSDLWAGPLAKLFAPVKLVSSRRDMGILRTAKHRLAYRLLGPAFDHVIAVSDEVRGYCLKQDRLPASRVTTIHNGLAFEKLSACAVASDLRCSLGISESAPVVVTVGNIRRVKGIDVLAESAARVIRHMPEAVFLVVGRPSEAGYFQELKTQIEALGIGRNIRFVGESNSVFSLLKACDVFVLPSRSEGFSNALIEAMACGLPCVATLVGGNAEAIEDGKNGYLVTSGDAEAIANRTLTLLADRVLRSEMSAAARATVEAKFTALTMIQKLVQCYDQLLYKGEN